jgi:hypothetical protein
LIWSCCFCIYLYLWIYIPCNSIWLLTKVSKIHIGGKTASSTNGAGKRGFPHVEDWN